MRKFEWYNRTDRRKTKINRENLMTMETYIDEDKLDKDNRATKEEAETGEDNEKFMTALQTKNAIDKALEGYTPGQAFGDGLPIRNSTKMAIRRFAK